MKTPSSTPLVSALVESMAKGDSHAMSGWMDASGASPAYTLTSATMANTASVRISALRRKYWVRADSSIPM